MKHSIRIHRRCHSRSRRPATLAAQGTALDRTKAPPVAPAPVFKVPSWTVDTLSNGARLVVVEKHDLPIVSLSIHFEGGTNQLGTQARRLVVRRRDDARRHRDAHRRSAEQRAGAAGHQRGLRRRRRVGERRLLVADADLRPDDRHHDGHDAAFDLSRRRRSNGCARSRSRRTRARRTWSERSRRRSRPSCSTATSRTAGSPNDADLKAVTRDDVANLAKAFFVPANATVYVVGDMTRAAGEGSSSSAHSRCGRPAGRSSRSAIPPRRLPGPTTIYHGRHAEQAAVADRAGAHHSAGVLARHGADRRDGRDSRRALPVAAEPQHPRSARLQLRLQFQVVAGCKGPGSERAAGAVTREKTDSSLIQAMKEIRGMTGSVPATADELVAARNSLTLSLPWRVQSIGGISNVVSRDRGQQPAARLVGAVHRAGERDDRGRRRGGVGEIHGSRSPGRS